MSWASNERFVQSAINYYVRQKQWRHIQATVRQGLKKQGNDPTLHFWSAASLVLEGKVPEGMRDLQKGADNRDVALATALALIHAHRQSKHVDKEAIKGLEETMKSELKQSGEVGLLHASLLMVAVGKPDKARELVDKLLKLNGSNEDALALKGWIDMTSGREAQARKSLKYFDEALKPYEGAAGSTNLEALFGKAAYMQKHKKDYAGALELLNEGVVCAPGFVPALLMKAETQLRLGDWDGALETGLQAADVEPQCLQVIQTQVLHTLVRTGRTEAAAQSLSDLVAALDATEPMNYQLFYEMCRLPARLSGRQPAILQQTRSMLQRALTAMPNNPEYQTEMALQQLMSGQQGEALKQYKKASELDASSLSALQGTILCQLLDNQVEEAAQQIEFLSEISASIGKTAQLAFLQALLASKQNKPSPQVFDKLQETADLYAKGFADLPLGPDYFMALEPDFAVQLARLYLQYTPSDAVGVGQAASPLLATVTRLLEPLTKVAPGQLEIVYLLAKAKHLSGHIEAAQSGAQYCLKQDSTYTPAHLLMAEVHLAQGSPRAAASSLEVGLSYSLQLRQAPMYHVLNARVQRAEGSLLDAKKTLVAAMNMPGVKKALQKVQGAKKVQQKSFPLSDRVAVFLELVRVHVALKESHEANKVMQNAINEFDNTPEEVRVAIANADLAVQRKDIDTALGILRSVNPDAAYFVQAKQRMADIYLRHNKDKQLYAACYRELVEKMPSGHTYLLLGDAYMSIQEPDRAIEIYKTAHKQNPRDSALASKIGSAMVKTHDYAKAINYYETAVKTGGQPELRADLASLYIKLSKYDKALRVIGEALEEITSTDLDGQLQTVKYLTLQARVHFAQGPADEAITVLHRAKETQGGVLSRVAQEQPEMLKHQQQLAADICIQTAEHHAKSHATAPLATQAYLEALSYDEASPKALLALANLHMVQGDLDQAKYHLQTLLKHDPLNNDATVLMADISFRQREYDTATLHFQQLLEREPEHYDALSRLVDLLKRSGELEKVPEFLDQAKAACARPDTEPGLNYCIGLHKRASSQPNEALKHFNLARKDSAWGIRALVQMIQICINPDNATVGGETFEGGDNSQAIAVGAKTATKLVKELQALGHGNTTQCKLLSAYTTMAAGGKSNLEAALQMFQDVHTSDRESMGPLLGVARAYKLMKQAPKARNQLKHAVKSFKWSFEEADDFEGAWLLLADIYISNGKMDYAQDLLKKVLTHNRSCSKGWEYMGFVNEKDGAYEDAAEFYENAWSFCGERDPTIGYKLAFNYLKAKKYVEAIEISHMVLKNHPETTKLRKDILEKARQGIRAGMP